MAKESKSKRYGLGEYESPDDHVKYSTWEARAEFFRTIDAVDTRVAISLYEKAFSKFVDLAWVKFPGAVPAPLRKYRDNESNLSFEEACFQSIKPILERNPATFINFSAEMTRIALLREFENIKLEKIVDAFPSWLAVKDDPQAAGLCSAIQAWSKEWKLDAVWCRDFALMALCAWLQNRWARFNITGLSFRRAAAELLLKHLRDITLSEFAKEDNAALTFKEIITGTLNNERFGFKIRDVEFSYPHWLPTFRTRQEWRQEVEKEFQSYLDELKAENKKVPTGTLTRFRSALNEYLKKIEAAAKSSGLKKSPVRWAEKHFIWTVHFQVQGWPMSKIEKLYAQPHKTVSDALNRTLDFVRLDRRPDLPAGRKPLPGDQRK